MSRVLSCAVVAVLSSLVLSCRDGDTRRSPTEPVPVTTAPVSLPGTWNGTMTVNRSGGPGPTCNLSLRVHDDGDPEVFMGDWTLQCPDGARGNGVAVVIALPFSFANLSGLASPTVLDGCQWASLVTRQGRKLSADWQKPNGSCPGSAIQGGKLDLTKAE